MGQPHKHAALIKAWADGAEIQAKEVGYFSKDSVWVTIKSPTWYSEIQYRIKPKTIRYRNFLLELQCNLTPGKKVVCICSEQENQYEPREKWLGFIKWLGDWQEVEV